MKGAAVAAGDTEGAEPGSFHRGEEPEAPRRLQVFSGALEGFLPSTCRNLNLIYELINQF